MPDYHTLICLSFWTSPKLMTEPCDLTAVAARRLIGAKKQAKAAEKQVMRGNDLGLLHGLPAGIKDLNPVAGLRSTWGSLLFKDHVPDEDDPMVANVRAAGANIFAKTNTPEFGAGANTRNRVYGATTNPFDTKLTPAGSSGGNSMPVMARGLRRGVA